MNYSASINYLFSLQRIGARMGIATVASLLARMGDPQNAYPSILVAGTNGKGSTAAMIASILRESGLRVGLTTSPHLVRFEERIVVDGAELTPEELVPLTETVREQADQMVARGGDESRPSFFETTTAMAFRHFRDRGVDLAVVEVGMGGRLDATSLVDAVLCLFTTIDLDHQEHLGDSLSAIAAEKAGILKSGSRALTSPQNPEAMQMLQRCAAIRGATLHEAERMWSAREGSASTFSLVPGTGADSRIDDVRLSLPGRHQWTNAVLAVAAATRLPGFHDRVTEASIRKGLAGARWPGRCEVVEERPTLLLDGAHNPGAARVLRSFLLENYTSKGKKVVMVFGAMADKDLPGILEPLHSCASRIIVTRAETPRAADPMVLEGVARRFRASVLRAPNPAAALSAARQEAGPEDVICVTGSLYLVGDVKAILQGQEPSFRQAL